MSAGLGREAIPQDPELLKNPSASVNLSQVREMGLPIHKELEERTLSHTPALGIWKNSDLQRKPQTRRLFLLLFKVGTIRWRRRRWWWWWRRWRKRGVCDPLQRTPLENLFVLLLQVLYHRDFRLRYCRIYNTKLSATHWRTRRNIVFGWFLPPPNNHLHLLLLKKPSSSLVASRHD